MLLQFCLARDEKEIRREIGEKTCIGIQKGKSTEKLGIHAKLSKFLEKKCLNILNSMSVLCQYHFSFSLSISFPLLFSFFASADQSLLFCREMKRQSFIMRQLISRRKKGRGHSFSRNIHPKKQRGSKLSLFRGYVFTRVHV